MRDLKVGDLRRRPFCSWAWSIGSTRNCASSVTRAVEARADAGDGGAVVVDHGEAEADGEQQAGEVVEVEGVLAAGGGESGFDAIPGHEDRGEHAEQVLAHGVEEAEVLGEQIVDGLKDELRGNRFCMDRLLRRWVPGNRPTACGSSAGNRSGCR